MLVSPQAAQLSIHFLLKKISSVAPPWGTWLRTHYLGIEREEIAQCSVEIKPTTSRTLLRQCVLYRCATTAANSSLHKFKGFLGLALCFWIAVYVGRFKFFLQNSRCSIPLQWLWHSGGVNSPLSRDCGFKSRNIWAHFSSPSFFFTQ